MGYGRKTADLAGSRFGGLTVIAEAAEPIISAGRRNRAWRCVCDCGREVTLATSRLGTGRAYSCGCKRVRHGMHDSKEYGVWEEMVGRCTRPSHRNFHHYGGRGITVCERWRDFTFFFADLGSRPFPDASLDRIDNDGNYEPGNVRWATRREQARNTRANRLVEIDGRAMPVVEAAESIGMAQVTFATRIRRGWSVERAVSQPVQQRCEVMNCETGPLDGPRDRGGFCSECADEVEAMERESAGGIR